MMKNLFVYGVALVSAFHAGIVGAAIVGSFFPAPAVKPCAPPIHWSHPLAKRLSEDAIWQLGFYFDRSMNNQASFREPPTGSGAQLRGGVECRTS